MKSQIRLQLEKQLNELHREIAELRKNRPTTHQIIAKIFADAWQANPPVLDAPQKSCHISGVQATTVPPVSAAAKAYQCSRQNLSQLGQVYGISAAELIQPDRLFEILLEKAPASKLRSRLACPQFRKDAREKLQFTC